MGQERESGGVSNSKPQRRTLVKVLSELVDRVNAHVFSVGSSKDTYRPLLLATNEAERVLDRERQHSKAKEEKQNDMSKETQQQKVSAMGQLMSCGCAGMAKHNDTHDGLEAGHPSCLTHMSAKAACTPANAPNLEGRFAKCTSRCQLRPSSVDLAFFEYLGPDSPASKQNCAQCGYYESAHRGDGDRPRNQNVCLIFRPHGTYEFDRYYCGCRGWD